MEMEVEESFQCHTIQFKEIKSTITNIQKHINGTLGRGNNIETDQESFLELPNRLSLSVNGDRQKLNNNYYERYICSKCNITKPSARLLDIHIQEDHDNVFFKLLSERQPMYECYVEQCDLKFNSPAERDAHCISIHKYAKRFGSIVDRSQLEKWETMKSMNEQCTVHKRKNMDDIQSNKRTAFDSDSINNKSQLAMTKSTLAFVPRQILLEKFSNMNVQR